MSVEFEVGQTYIIPKYPQFEFRVVSISDTRKSMVVAISNTELQTVRISSNHIQERFGSVYFESAVPLSKHGSRAALRAINKKVPESHVNAFVEFIDHWKAKGYTYKQAVKQYELTMQKVAQHYEEDDHVDI